MLVLKCLLLCLQCLTTIHSNVIVTLTASIFNTHRLIKTVVFEINLQVRLHLWGIFNPLPPSNAIQKRKKKRKYFQFCIVTTKKISLLWKMKFNYLGIFQSLKLRILLEKFLSISLKLISTWTTSGCYGLMTKRYALQTKVMCFIWPYFKQPIFSVEFFGSFVAQKTHALICT